MSVDIFLGLPYNIASYSLLLHMVAKLTGYTPGEFIWTGGDIHLYSNHRDQALLQITRKPGTLPELEIYSGQKDIDDFKYSDFIIHDYNALSHIPAKIAV